MPYQYNPNTKEVIDVMDGQVIVQMGDLVDSGETKKEQSRPVFYMPADKVKGIIPRVIDTIRLIDGVQCSFYSAETLEDLQKRYPGAAIGSIDEVIAEQEAMLTSEPIEIAEDVYYRALGELPPEDHRRDDSGASFKMCEYLSGRITAVYAVIGERYFTFNDICSISHADIILKTMQSEAWSTLAQRPTQRSDAC